MELLFFAVSDPSSPIYTILNSESVQVALVGSVVGPILVLFVGSILSKFSSKKESDKAEKDDKSLHQFESNIRAELRGENESLKEKVADFEKQVDELVEEVKNLEKLRAEAQNQAVESNFRYTELVNKNESLNFELVMLTKEVAALREAILDSFRQREGLGE